MREPQVARRPSPATVAAERLRAALEGRGVAADVHAGDGVALVSVWVEVVVWCEFGPDGWRYRWWTGRISQSTGCYVYTGCRADAVETAARRVADRYAEVRRTHPLSPVVAERLASLPSPHSTTGRGR
ncbi:hypothetical protein [Microbispora bryophytorum]|uniref:hypothetical protein n=1 Tax=Microbispora bryophytorum TaxID=1460882 RepID=UPI00340B156B